MPFEHRIVQDDDPAWLDCDNVEALDGRDVLADQLRDDARYLAIRYPAVSSGVSGFDQHSAADQGDTTDAGRTDMDQQKARCLSRVNELLAVQKQTARAGWLKRLAGGAAVAVVAVVCTAIVWRIQFTEQVNQDLLGSSVAPSTSQLTGPARVVEHSSRERFRPGLTGNEPFFVSTPAMTSSSVRPTPVTFEMPAVFRSASEPEMEGLLDLYDTETAGPVTIGF